MSIVLWLLIVWLITSVIIVYRLNTLGAYTSICATKTLDYMKEVGHADPGSVRLTQSYSQWARALNMSDPSNYIKVGLGFADGKGISLKNITPDDPDSKNYLAYYFQAPGTPIVIGTMIKLFGERAVFPYFLLILIVHFITALLACILATKFVKNDIYIFGAGLLSLLCLPVLDFDFGIGLFSSEPLAAPCIGIALITLSNFWTNVEAKNPSYKNIIVLALTCGVTLGCASYFRDIYSTFAYFSFVILILAGMTKPQKFKGIALFVIVSALVLAAIQFPWEKRNQRYFNEFTMSGSSYCGNAFWYQIWYDYKEFSKWSEDAGMGLGNYLAPDKSVQVLKMLSENKQGGNKYAWESLFKAIAKNPSAAILYKLRVYDTLWFGQKNHWFIYIWCLFSAVSFVIFICWTRFRFIPELYLFPLFILCISTVVHYEHRYVQPFFLFITPITLMWVIQRWRKKSLLDTHS